MRVIVVGLGVQGGKRQSVAGNECVYTVDPQNPAADFNSIADVPLDAFDAALVCVPESAKSTLIQYFLAAGKHVLVEKPLMEDETVLTGLSELARHNKVVCYTAYNHRFEPHFIRMKKCLRDGTLGKIYSVRLFYGNGTARQVRESAWRDCGNGVLNDLGSHLLDTILFWFGTLSDEFQLTTCRRFENRAPDHVTIHSNGETLIQLEASLLSWRNDFTADIHGEKGSAHIRSLCKWGPATFVLRDRVFPSGRPKETVDTIIKPDQTWVMEYKHFKGLCENPAAAGFGNIDNDLWLQSVLQKLSGEADGITP